MTLILDPADPVVAAWKAGQQPAAPAPSPSKDTIRRARWRAKNPGRQRAYDARYAAAHPDRKREAFRRWYYANRERAIARVIAWRRAKANP